MDLKVLKLKRTYERLCLKYAENDVSSTTKCSKIQIQRKPTCMGLGTILSSVESCVRGFRNNLQCEERNNNLKFNRSLKVE